MSDAATIVSPDPAPAPPPAAPAAPAAPPAAAVDPTQPGSPPAEPASTGDQSDWRRVLAGEDDKVLQNLERFASPNDFYKAFTDTQTALRNKTEGMVKIPGEGASDDERAAFAKALGIPEAPDKYERLAPPEGLELSDADKAFLDGAVKELHQLGGVAASPEVVKTLETFYHKAMQEQAAQMTAAAVQRAAESKQTLQKLYGNNFELEMKHANAALAAFGPRDPEKARGFLNRQMADGTKLGDDPEIVQMLVRASRATQEDPMFLRTLSDGPSSGADVEARIKDIMKLKGTPEYDKRADEMKALLVQRQRSSGQG